MVRMMRALGGYCSWDKAVRSVSAPEDQLQAKVTIGACVQKIFENKKVLDINLIFFLIMLVKKKSNSKAESSC
jgi:hypothetical protein